MRIGYALAVSQSDITVGEYARFAADAGFVAGNVCYNFENGTFADRTPRTWRPIGREDVADTLPATCLTWAEAQAYVTWLAKKTGRPYRMMSEAEFEYANRAGSTTTFWWGDDIGKTHANCNGCGSIWDRKMASPERSFPPNPFGLYDTAGNAWSWMADCWNDSYVGAPTDGSPWLTGDCTTRTVRGAGWSTNYWILRAARRVGDAANGRHGTVGFQGGVHTVGRGADWRSSVSPRQCSRQIYLRRRDGLDQGYFFAFAGGADRPLKVGWEVFCFAGGPSWACPWFPSSTVLRAISLIGRVRRPVA